MTSCRLFTGRTCYMETVPSDKTVEMLNCVCCILATHNNNGKKVVDLNNDVTPQ